MICLLIILIGGIILLETPALVKEHAYNELIVFTVFLIAGIYLAMVQLYDLPFYNAIPEWAAVLQLR